MKNLIPTIVLVLIITCTSCTQKTNDAANPGKVENTLKSVSFLFDSTGIDPHQLYLSLERVNLAIDSIGYPDAGYKLWQVQSDTNKVFRFMMEGYWPDQAIYDVIHNHKSYMNATTKTSSEVEKLWSSLKTTSYTRLNLIQ